VEHGVFSPLWKLKWQVGLYAFKRNAASRTQQDILVLRWSGVRGGADFICFTELCLPRLQLLLTLELDGRAADRLGENGRRPAGHLLKVACVDFPGLVEDSRLRWKRLLVLVAPKTCATRQATILSRTQSVQGGGWCVESASAGGQRRPGLHSGVTCREQINSSCTQGWTNQEDQGA
jgi:hypothetical protein